MLKPLRRVPVKTEKLRRSPRRMPALDGKLKPSQQRAHSTYDAILEAAGALLGEVGVERLSTNLVCKRAGLTPPALYRYFPNKYALLKELGARLMAAQDKVVFAWQDGVRDADLATVEASAEYRRQVQQKVNAVTKTFPGGGWVMRALRAVPTLSAVRIESRETVAERDFAALAKLYPKADRRVLRVAATLSVEVMYASTELVMDQPELDAELVTQEIAYMTALYLESFSRPRKKLRAR
jgi:AcrR family transcriptional regulator